MGRPESESVMLMPIGRFARASRLSVKSLRNYDESGLLPAAFVDPHSGYRYYRLEQLARADAIRSLRMVDMPLSAIAATLDGDDPEEALTSHLAALEHRRAEIDQMAAQLKRRISTKEFTMSQEITVKPLSPLTVAAYRTHTTHTQIFKDIPTGFGAVLTALAAVEVSPAGLPFTVFHQAPDPDTSGDIAMCVPVADVPTLAGGVERVDLPGCSAASVIHQGSYEDMGRAYASVSRWIHERGHRIAGSPREVYLNSPDEVAESELRTEILFPIDSDDEL
ncbi:MAG: MerR family transcriptional regulator [Ornithinimicrobium sp.]